MCRPVWGRAPGTRRVAPAPQAGPDGARHAGKVYGLVRRRKREDVHDVYELAKTNQAYFPARSLCRVLRVSTSGYCDRLERAPSARALADWQLRRRFEQIHQASDATYGAPRIHDEVVEHGVVAGHNRVARLMRENGLHGVSRRRG